MYMTDVEQLDIQSNGRYNGSCLYLPRDVRDCAISNTAKIIAANIFTKSKHGDVKQDYDKLQDQFRFSRMTISRGLNVLKDKFIKRLKRSTYHFERKALSMQNDKVLYDAIPDVFFKDFNYKGQTVRLTPAEIIVGGYLYTVLNNKKKGQNAYTTSLNVLSMILPFATSTISKALNKLKNLKIIEYLDFEKGVNKNQLSTYHLNYKVLNKYAIINKEQNIKRQKRELWDDNRIEKFYAERQHLNQDKADTARRYAFQDKAYGSNYNKLTDLVLEQIRQKSRGNDVTKINVQIENLEKICDQRLSELGITPEHFSPTYYAKCKRCKDTGWLIKNGKRCDCYLKEWQ